ncbi:MAG: hypothetical protein SGI88_04440 [Candidatus Hydrogenedentes bacterium]|nr:hypothetical protein [Candidatus Hydrogenedentota bacterium]
MSLLLLTLLTANAATGNAHAVDWQTISMHQVTQLKRIKSIQFEVVTSRKQVNPNQPAITIPLYSTISQYAFEGGKFFADIEFDTTLPSTVSETKLVMHSVAFNLSDYQYLDKRQFVLTVRKTPTQTSYGIRPPILLPYGFLFRAVQEDLSSIQVENLWSNRIARTELIDKTTVSDQTCIIIDAFWSDPVPSGTQRTRLYLATALEYFPLRYQNISASDHVFVDYVIEEFKTFETPEGRVIVPIRSVKSSVGGPDQPVLIEEYAFRQDSVKVNDEIPDESFSIPTLSQRLLNKYKGINNTLKLEFPEVETFSAAWYDWADFYTRTKAAFPIRE